MEPKWNQDNILHSENMRDIQFVLKKLDYLTFFRPFKNWSQLDNKTNNSSKLLRFSALNLRRTA